LLCFFQVNSVVMSVSPQDRQQVRSVDQSDRFILRPFVTLGSELAGCYKNPSVCTFMSDRTVEISHRIDSNGVGISLRLDDVFAATDMIRIEHDCIYAIVSTGTSHLDFSTGGRELLLKYLSDQMLKILPFHCSKIGPCLKCSYYRSTLYDPTVVTVKFHQ